MSDKEKEEKSFSFVDKRRQYEDEGENEEETAPESTKTTASGEMKTDDKPAQQAAGDASKDSSDQEPKPPPLDFSTFILSLYSSALYHLGGIQDPVSGKTTLDLDLAKQNIEFIKILEDKTEGNLNDEEKKLIQHTLYDLRIKFVEASKKG